MSIYTKTGDNGNSKVCGSNSQVPKSSMVFDVLGTFDELSSSLGFLHNSTLTELKDLILNIQTDLFLLNSMIAFKKYTLEDAYTWDAKVKFLEEKIDFFENNTFPLTKFILPGGHKDSAYLHMSRTICRRLERLFVKYMLCEKNTEISFIEIYLNRLSDLLFSAARYVNAKNSIPDVVINS